jgi:hypothetical protein
MTTSTARSGPIRSVLAGLGAGLERWMEAAASYSMAARCARHAEHLLSLSDEELARRGLTRDQILHHAFRPYMGL